MSENPTPAPGSPFPSLEVIDRDGAVGNLLDLVAGTAAIIHFMRSPTCPICLNHATTLERMRASSEIPDVAIIFLTPGGHAEAAQVDDRLRPRGVIVRATEHGHHALGMSVSLTLQQSGTFVLDSDGVILSAITATLPSASFSRSQTRSALAARPDDDRPTTQGQSARPASAP